MGAQLCLIQSPSSGQNGRQPGSPSRPAARDAASVGVAPASRWRSPQQCVTRRGDAPGATPDSPADGPGAARPPGSVVAGAALPGLPPRCPCSGQPPSGSPSQPPHPVQEAMTLRPPPPRAFTTPHSRVTLRVTVCWVFQWKLKTYFQPAGRRWTRVPSQPCRSGLSVRLGGDSGGAGPTAPGRPGPGSGVGRRLFLYTRRDLLTHFLLDLSPVSSLPGHCAPARTSVLG